MHGFVWREMRGELDLAGTAAEKELVRRGLGEGCTGGPASVDGVVGGIECAVEVSGVGAVASKSGGVGFGMVPVLIVGAKGVRRIREGDAHFEMA